MNIKTNWISRSLQSKKDENLFVVYLTIYILGITGYQLVSGVTSIINIDNRVFSILFRTALLLFCIFLLSIKLNKRNSVYHGKMIYPIAVFWCLYTAQLLLDTYVDPVSLSREPYEYIVFAIGAGFIPMMAFMLIINDYTLDRIVKIVYIAVVISCGLNGYSALTSEETLYYHRLFAVSLNPISLGHLAVTLLVLSVFFLIKESNNKTVLKIIYILNVIFASIILSLSGSRGAFLSLIVVIFMYLLTNIKEKYLLVTITTFAIFFYGLYELSSYIENEYMFSPLTRLEKIADPSAIHSSHRLFLISNAWEQFLDAPLIGSGLEVKTSMIYPHNVVVESFMATGVIGGISFVFIIIGGLIISWKLLKKEIRHVWIPLLYIQYIVGAQFSGSLWSASLMWIMLGAVLMEFEKMKIKNIYLR